MHRVRGRAEPQGSIVRSLTLHFFEEVVSTARTRDLLVTRQLLYQLRQNSPSITQVRTIYLFSKPPFRWPTYHEYPSTLDSLTIYQHQESFISSYYISTPTEFPGSFWIKHSIKLPLQCIRRTLKPKNNKDKLE